jgi:hypothetical protein
MSESRAQRNKAFVLEAFETLFNRKDFVAAEKFWSPNGCVANSGEDAWPVGGCGLSYAAMPKRV